jgi:hypothetical protein
MMIVDCYSGFLSLVEVGWSLAVDQTTRDSSIGEYHVTARRNSISLTAYGDDLADCLTKVVEESANAREDVTWILKPFPYIDRGMCVTRDSESTGYQWIPVTP